MNHFPPDSWYDERGVNQESREAIRAAAEATATVTALPVHARRDLAALLVEIPVAMAA